MKRRIHLIATFCLAGALALTGAGCSKNGPALPEAPTEVVPVAGLATPVPTTQDPTATTPAAGGETETTAAADNAQKKVSTVLYYQDASGYVVPVMREIPYTEGIAKAALMKLVASEEDQQALAARGVEAPIPEGSQIDLDIAGGVASVDVQLSEQLASSQDESCMLAAVVNTLMEFESVNQVKVLINGQKIAKLPQGTEIKEVYHQKIENMDPMGMPSSANAQTQLYFANQTGSFLVPVKRVTTGEITALTAAQAMTDPGPTGKLVSLLPPNCRILSVNVSDDGIATVDVSEEFLSLSALPANEQMAVRGMNLALTSIEGVKQVNITVEGEAYEPVAATLGTGSGSEYLNTMP